MDSEPRMMDYSYFSAAPQPYQMFGLPPTPAASQTPHGEDSNYSPHENPYDPSNPYHAFDPSFRFDPSTLIQQPTSPTRSLHKTSIASVSEINGSNNNSNNIIPHLHHSESTEEQMRARSSSEEKESLTPAQSRRKAQNRAAQRAFRERKERHVKELEHKLTTLECTTSSLHGENERLKRELAKVATENEILRATSSHPNGSSAVHHTSSSGTTTSPPTTTGPMTYSPTDFYTSIFTSSEGVPAAAAVTKKPGGVPSHRITVSATTGEKLLAAGATWDLIQGHDMFRRGLVDVGDVCERLKRVAKCDGQGPVFEEGDVRRAVEESVAGGSDELI